ncbi:hypothetical protein R6Z07M_006256 [Ovis aries]
MLPPESIWEIVTQDSELLRLPLPRCPGQQADEQKQAALLMPEYCRLVGRWQASTGPRPGWASWWYPHQQHGSAVTTAEWSGLESRNTLTPERRQSDLRSQRSSIIMNEKANGMPNPSWLDVWLKLITGPLARHLVHLPDSTAQMPPHTDDAGGAKKEKALLPVGLEELHLRKGPRAAHIPLAKPGLAPLG